MTTERLEMDEFDVAAERCAADGGEPGAARAGAGEGADAGLGAGDGGR